MNNKSYNVLKIIGLGIIVVVLVIILLLQLNGKFNSNFLFSFKDDYKLVISQEYEPKFTNFKFDLISADLEVLYSDNDKIKLEIYDKDDKNVIINDNNDVLDVKLEKNRIFCIGICYSSKKVRLFLPREYEGEFNIASASGDVFVDEFNNITANIKTASGDVDVRGSSKITLRTVSGDIDVLGAKSADISSTSGELTLRNIVDLKFDTKSGDVELSDINNIIGRTISGEIEGYNINGNFELNTTSGDVDLEHVLLDKNSSVSTVSGEVDIKLIKPVNVNESTVSGYKEIYNVDRNSEITLKITTVSGDIEIN